MRRRSPGSAPNGPFVALPRSWGGAGCEGCAEGAGFCAGTAAAGGAGAAAWANGAGGAVGAAGAGVLWIGPGVIGGRGRAGTAAAGCGAVGTAAAGSGAGGKTVAGLGAGGTTVAGLGAGGTAAECGGPDGTGATGSAGLGATNSRGGRAGPWNGPFHCVTAPGPWRCAWPRRQRRVQPLQLARADAVRRSIGLMRTQRRPACARQRPLAHHRALRRRADPADQGRRKHRARHARAGHPAPAVAPIEPAAVVRRRKAPGGSIHPGPAPGAQPDPAAIAERHPVDCHDTRAPHRTVLRMLLPLAMAIQVFDAGHFRRHVGRSGAARGLLQALHRHGEVVLLLRQPLARGVAERAVAPEGGALAGMQRHGKVVADDLQLTAQHHGVAGLAQTVHAIQPRAQGLESCFGMQHLQLGRHLGRAHQQRQLAALQPELQPLVVQAQRFEFGLAAQQQRGRSDLQLERRPFARGDQVAAGDRPVEQCGHPLALLGLENPGFALQRREPADAPGRIVLRPSLRQREKRHAAPQRTTTHPPQKRNPVHGPQPPRRIAPVNAGATPLQRAARPGG